MIVSYLLVKRVQNGLIVFYAFFRRKAFLRRLSKQPDEWMLTSGLAGTRKTFFSFSVSFLLRVFQQTLIVL
ncbi:MAG: hypothetical protein LUE08_06780 [Akkermansiaceae bacterium]|nr:hypothetical protein [Akkermansiaceae bacterium]